MVSFCWLAFREALEASPITAIILACMQSGVGLGWLSQYAYGFDIPSESPFHHKGAIASVFAVMFGYMVRAEWLRVLIHFAHLVIALPLAIWAYRKDGKKASLKKRLLTRVPWSFLRPRVEATPIMQEQTSVFHLGV